MTVQITLQISTLLSNVLLAEMKFLHPQRNGKDSIALDSLGRSVTVKAARPLHLPMKKQARGRATGHIPLYLPTIKKCMQQHFQCAFKTHFNYMCVLCVLSSPIICTLKY